ncbi:MAG: hypothetical protein NVSMB57_09430 [Actinomycetota bacterium]
MARFPPPTSAGRFPQTIVMDPARPTHVGVLGGFELSVGQTGVALPLSAERLISFLAFQPGPVQRALVAGVLWGDTSDRHASGSLRTALWRLASAPAVIVTCTSTQIMLDSAVRIDYRECSALANRILDRTRPLQPEDFDERALSSDVLPDWDDDWVLIEREGFRQLRLRALETLCERATEMGMFGQGAQMGLAAVAGEPLRESARRVLIAAHIADGNIAAAQSEYNAFRALLNEELGIEPSEVLRALIAHASQQS